MHRTIQYRLAPSPRTVTLLLALSFLPFESHWSPIQAQSTAPDPGTIRNVSPKGVSAPPVTGPLKRVAPSQTYLERLNPPAAEIPDTLSLRRVQVLSSSVLAADNLKVTLAHIKSLAPEETCKKTDGRSWPCGAHARTFLRGLVRQYQITCEKIAELSAKAITATCKRGTIDLATSIVQYGWAEVEATAPDELQHLVNEARRKKIGLWRTVFPSDQPSNSDDGTHLSSGKTSLKSDEGSLIDLQTLGLEEFGSDPINPFDLPFSETQEAENQ